MPVWWGRDQRVGVETEHLDHPPGRLIRRVCAASLSAKLGDVYPVHHVPEPAVVQRGCRDRHDREVENLTKTDHVQMG